MVPASARDHQIGQEEEQPARLRIVPRKPEKPRFSEQQVGDLAQYPEDVRWMVQAHGVGG